METCEIVKMQQIYNTYWWFKGKYKIVNKLINKMIKKSYIPEVLDLGCGPAYFSRFYRYTGIDCSIPSEFSCGSIIKARIEDVKLDKKYDVILALDILEHLEDDRVICRYLRNNLKDNGIAIVTVPAYQWLFSEHDRVCRHYRRYSKKQLKDLLSEFEYKIYYYNTLLFPVELIYRIVTKGRNNLKPLPKPLNVVLYVIFSFEYYLLPLLPFGMSLIAIVTGKREREQND